MKVLLDTTYLMPAIGVSVKEISPDTLGVIRGGGHEAAISEVSLLELSAKGAKLVASGALTADRVIRGVIAAKRDEELEKIPIVDEDLLGTAISLRGRLRDFLDCLILSSAINRCDVLLTEDSLIHALTTDEVYGRLVGEINPEFVVSSHKALPGLM
jgi:PIN domain nuclease of toxin-antitoxin system